MITDKSYDIIVVGAGPAGSLAALKAVQGGARVLLLEKHPKIGVPVCCAEGVTTFGIERVIKPWDEWISTTIEGASVTSPSGKTLTITHPHAGYVLDREKFDAGLAKLAGDFGADIHCASPVVGLKMLRNGRIEGVFAEHEGNTLELDAKVVIAADGVESEIAALAGVARNYRPRDVFSACQYLAEDIGGLNSNVIQIHLGNEIAPGGYAWVFPKGNGRANIGIAIGADKGKGRTARDYLDTFIRLYYPNIVCKAVVMGVVPAFNSGMPLVKGNLMIAGDAARLVDSLSGAGISNALLSGSIAGATAAGYIRGQGRFSDYPRRFMRQKRRELYTYKALRKIYVRASDRELERLVEAVERFLPDKKIQALNIPGMACKFLFKNPGLFGLRRIWRRNEISF